MADAEKALEYIIFLSKHLDKENSGALASLILLDLNFSENHDGYRYLLEAIKLYLECTECPRMKVIYAEVGKTYKCRFVERPMRYAIDEALNYRNMELWCKLFPTDGKGHVIHPTNSEFIARIAGLIKVWQVWKKEEEHDK